MDIEKQAYMQKKRGLRKIVALIVVVSTILTLLFGLRSIFESRKNPSFEINQMERLSNFNAMSISWTYDVPSSESIALYIGDSMEQEVVFRGTIQGKGNLYSITRLKPDCRKSYFIEITNMRHTRTFYKKTLTAGIVNIESQKDTCTIYE